MLVHPSRKCGQRNTSATSCAAQAAHYYDAFKRYHKGDTVLILLVDKATESDVEPFLPTIKKYRALGIMVFGIHANNGVYQGRVFDNTQAPSYAESHGDYALLVEDYDTLRLFKNLVDGTSL